MELFANNCIDKSIAILGDICLDLYYFISEENAEISVETNLPTYSVKNSKFELGGASNVAINCKTIGIKNVDIYGLVGNDYYGKIINYLLTKENIGIDNLLIQNNNFNSNVYHKIYKDSKELPRYDFGNFNIPDRELQDTILNNLEKNIKKYELIIINEQVLNSIHNDYFSNRLNQIISKHQDVIWITDCRTKNNIYKKTIHKLNHKEGYNLVKQLTNNFQGITENINDSYIANYLFNYWELPLILTRGENGAYVVTKKGLNTINGLHVIQKLDTVGAGDSFLAGLSFGLCCNYDLTQSAEIGNLAATVSCKILFETGHPTLNEIQELAEKSDFRYNPEIASDIRSALYYNETEIEIINPNIINSFSRYPKICIFDHDGTISVLRQGWEEIMKEIMIQIITGDTYQKISRNEIENIANQVNDLIEKTTGVQTIIQMKELINLIKINGYVNSSEILDAWDYKKIYNDKLLTKVSERVDKFKKGLINIEDVTIKGSIAALDNFSKNGSIVYLASGTDQQDVIEEATTLGYEKYFTGGIYGSVGDINLDPKQKVIKKLIKEIELNPNIDVSECVVFGDGPVEMREAKKHGLVAIGLISDETRRWGENISKRERLILGGADLLIPDFSCLNQLTELLGWEQNGKI